VELRNKYLLETCSAHYSRIQEARRTRDIPTLKPASKRDPAPFDQVEVPTDKLDVVCKMVDGVFQVLPVQMFQRVDSSDSIDKHSSLFVETGGYEFQPPKDPVTPQVSRMKREGAAAQSSSSICSMTRSSSTSSADGSAIVVAVGLAEFVKDMRTLMRTLESGPVNSLCNDRMKMLEAKFELYHLQMKEVEDQRLKSVPHRDFFNVRKVDTHVHHSSCMTQRALLDFIKQKLVEDDKKAPHEREVVYVEPKPKEGHPSHMTLTQVFQSLSLSAYDLSRDTLDMHADRSLWHRFDKFNLKYNPFGKSMLRQIFLKTDNVMGGRFLAEITRGVFKDLEDSKCVGRTVLVARALAYITPLQVSARGVSHQHIREGRQRVG
jgi:AMP deaminase